MLLRTCISRTVRSSGASGVFRSLSTSCSSLNRGSRSRSDVSRGSQNMSMGSLHAREDEDANAYTHTDDETVVIVDDELYELIEKLKKNERANPLNLMQNYPEKSSDKLIVMGDESHVKHNLLYGMTHNISDEHTQSRTEFLHDCGLSSNACIQSVMGYVNAGSSSMIRALNYEALKCDHVKIVTIGGMGFGPLDSSTLDDIVTVHEETKGECPDLTFTVLVKYAEVISDQELETFTSEINTVKNMGIFECVAGNMIETSTGEILNYED